MTAMAAPSRSTKIAGAAPRDSASMPAAPLPANRSRNAAPRRSGSRIANSVCLTRSPSGRVPAPGAGEPDPARRAGDDPAGVSHRRRRRPAASPAEMRRSQPASSSGASASTAGRSARRAGRAAPRRARAPGRRARGATGPGARRPAAAAGRSGRARARRPRGAARSPSRRARSRRAISATALSRAWATSSVDVRDEHAERLDGPAADPAAELVELGEPEPVGALDDHHRRLRHVDADLDDGRADQDVELAVAEPRHLRVAVRRP